MRKEGEEKWKESVKNQPVVTEQYERQQTVGWGSIENNYDMIKHGQTDQIQDVVLEKGVKEVQQAPQ